MPSDVAPVSVLVFLVLAILILVVVALLWCLRHGVRSRVTLGNALRRRSEHLVLDVGHLAFYGDSLTAGAGASAGRDYPSLVAQFFGLPFTCLAVGGATSTQMADAAERAGRPTSGVALIWLGRNNFEEQDVVLADVARVLDVVGPGSRSRVLGVIPSSEPDELPDTPRGRAIESLNSALRSRYGDRFIDVGQVLFGDRQSISPSDAASVRCDHVHLNDRGYAMVAACVVTSLLQNPHS